MASVRACWLAFGRRPSVVCGGGIFAISIVGLTLKWIGAPYPEWAQIIAATAGMVLGILVSIKQEQ